MKLRLWGAAGTCLVALCAAKASNAAFVLTIDDPLTARVDVTVTDGGAGDTSAPAGSIVYNNSLGAFTVVVSTPDQRQSSTAGFEWCSGKRRSRWLGHQSHGYGLHRCATRP